MTGGQQRQKSTINYIAMIKISSFVICLLLATTALAQSSHQNTDIQADTNGTESYFFSPHGLGRTPEVEMALQQIQGQVRPHRTTFNVSAVSYTIDNVVIGVVYNPSKQQINIPKKDFVEVTGGRFEFTYKFNYTRIENRNNITGYAYGSVLSDPITYYKEFAFCQGFLCWRLPPASPMQPVNITQKMTLKRMEPFNDIDFAHIQDMLDNITTGIDPANIKAQILPTFNQIFPLALNDSLNHEIFNEAINYTYHSNTHGDLKMNIIHQLWGFGVDPETGYRIIFVTKIDGFDDPTCNLTVPTTPASFEIYGGSQTFHLNCLYQSVVYYMQSNGWLDTVLNNQWEVDAFQFYAGDLFDLISNLYLTFSPRAILDGECKAQKDRLRLTPSREFDSNTYAFLATYNCTLKGTNTAGSTVQVMKITAKTRIYITVEATTKSLSFKITEAEFDDLTFNPVGNYFVNNIDLAFYRATKILKKVVGTQTFGTGFPTVVRELPKTRVDTNWVFYYDSSHIGSVPSFDTA